MEFGTGNSKGKELGMGCGIIAGLVNKRVSQGRPAWGVAILAFLWLAGLTPSLRADVPILWLFDSWRYEQTTNLRPQ